MPVLLRRVKEGMHYNLIGECYLHTMMNGRAINMQEELEIKTEMFELR